MQLSATKKLAFSVTTLALALVAVEAASQVIYRWRSPDDHWIFQAAKRQHRLFQEHPFLSVAPIANVRSQHGDTVITHNRDGLRGYELSRDGNRERIAALGGSSTYGVYVRDEHVWPHQLEHVLGSDYEVLNLGVPGYTSVESTIQTTFFLSDLKPTTALYYVGWNDLRNVHVANLDPYSAEFHGASQPSNLDVHRTYPGWFALAFYLGRVSDILSYERASAVPTQQKFTKDIDERALSLYRRNIESIIALCKAHNIHPVFITHPLNADALTGEGSYGWIPYLKDRHLPRSHETVQPDGHRRRELSTDSRDRCRGEREVHGPRLRRPRALQCGWKQEVRRARRRGAPGKRARHDLDFGWCPAGPSHAGLRRDNAVIRQRGVSVRRRARQWETCLTQWIRR